MPLTPAEREALIGRYADGPARLRTALDRVPEEARHWRPAPGEFSVHETVCHCADSETNAAARIRYLVTEREPLILGYDTDVWARVLDYASHPIDTALPAIEAARANTTPLLRRLPESAWAAAGTHTESGPYTAEDWLAIYAAHLEEHAEQIERTYAAWRESGAHPAAPKERA
jgi:hypothetical protein